MENVPRFTDRSTVTLISTLGDDRTIVNAARVSFAKKIDRVSDGDRRLLRYLARNEHFSPFRHAMVQLHVRCPEFVARQMYKHVVGIEATSAHPVKDHAWNEVSGRYVDLSEFYLPPTFRFAASDKKQGSGGQMTGAANDLAIAAYTEGVRQAFLSYRTLQSLGVANELARAVLPLSVMTEFYWTASFQAAMHFVRLRMAPDAQREIKDVAEQIADIVRSAFPDAFSAYAENVFDGDLEYVRSGRAQQEVESIAEIVDGMIQEEEKTDD